LAIFSYELIANISSICQTIWFWQAFKSSTFVCF